MHLAENEFTMATNPLPLLLSSFIGRKRELAEIKRLLPGHRLLTLTGPGGCGKTRLALEVAASLGEHFENRVWVVELGVLSDPALVQQAVALALGVREQAGRTLLDTLTDFLRPGSTLLVLDNCEHLVTACATLAQALLRMCPQLRLLATSREALHIDGEKVWLVPSLSFPDQEPLLHLEGLETYDAVRFFIDRAADLLSAFALTPQNAPAIVQICQRLDGIPLAIELAVARLRVLSVEQLAARLDDCFGLLTEGSRTALPRQQTLRATIDWSYSLLSERERMLFRRLSVFAGGFTLEAVETICAGEGVEQQDLLDLLSHLVHKSLVAVAEQGIVTRYRLLETVRQYAWEQLQCSGEEAVIRKQHARFFLTLAEAAESHLKSADRLVWLDQLEKEHDNLRTVLKWVRAYAKVEGAEMGLHLVGILFWFWYFRGYVSEARHWFEGMLALTDSANRVPARAAALFGAGTMAWVQGDLVIAHARLGESAAFWRELADKRGLAYSLTFLGLVTGLQGNHTAGCLLQEESSMLFREIGDMWGLALSCYWLGAILRRLHDYTAASSAFEESLVIFQKVGDKWGISLALQSLGIVAYHQGDYVAARSKLEEGLQLGREVGDKWDIAHILNSLGVVLQRQGDYGQAASLFEEGLALHREVGDTLGIAFSLRNLASLAQHQGGYGHTIALLHAGPALRLYALGPAIVYRGETALTSSDWTYVKVKELLFYLLCHRARTKEQIGLALWPDASPAQLRGNLHNTLYHLRHVLGKPEWIVFTHGSYAFNHQLAYWFDIEVFESFVARAQQFQANAPLQAISALEEAAKLYQGDFLEDLVTGDWSLLRRDELRRMYQETLLTLGRLCFAEGHYTQAADAYRQVIAHDHYLEVAHRELMRCYVRLGERGQALRHYQSLVEWMHKELSSPPTAETRALFERLRRGEDS